MRSCILQSLSLSLSLYPHLPLPVSFPYYPLPLSFTCIHLLLNFSKHLSLQNLNRMSKVDDFWNKNWSQDFAWEDTPIRCFEVKRCALASWNLVWPLAPVFPGKWSISHWISLCGSPCKPVVMSWTQKQAHQHEVPEECEIWAPSWCALPADGLEAYFISYQTGFIST